MSEYMKAFGDLRDGDFFVFQTRPGHEPWSALGIKAPSSIFPSKMIYVGFRGHRAPLWIGHQRTCPPEDKQPVEIKYPKFKIVSVIKCLRVEIRCGDFFLCEDRKLALKSDQIAEVLMGESRYDIPFATGVVDRIKELEIRL